MTLRAGEWIDQALQLSHAGFQEAFRIRRVFLRAGLARNNGNGDNCDPGVAKTVGFD
jgi:hypothetical protein